MLINLRSNKILWSVILFLIGVGFILIYISSNLSEYIPFKEYDFDLSLEFRGTSIKFKDFDFYYDFTNQKGNISFRIKSDKSYSKKHGKLIFILPNLKENSFRLTTKFTNEIWNWKLKPITYNTKIEVWNERTKVSVKNFSRVLTPYEIINLEFESNIEPKGEFEFDHDDNKIRKGVFRLDLGEKYYCDNDCFRNLENVEQYTRSEEGEKNIIKLRTTNETKTNEFDLYTLNKNANYKRNLYLGLGISLLVAGIILLIENLFKLKN